MVTNWKRMQPSSILILFLSKIKEFIVPLFLSLFAGGYGSGYTVWLFPLLLLTLFGYCVLYWIFFQFSLEEQELRIKKGIFIKKNRYIQSRQVQSVAVHTTVIHRLFHTVKVKLETAGGGLEAEAELTAVSPETAKMIQAHFGSKEDMNFSDLSQSGETKLWNSHCNEENLVYTVPWNHIIAAGATSGKIGIVFSAAAALFSQMDQFIPAEVYEDSYGALVSMGAFVLTALFLGLAAVTWLISIAVTFIQYGNFEIKKADNELTITRGLLERRQLTLKLDRITSVRYITNPVRQGFGLWSIYVDSAGGGLQEEQLSTILLPLGNKHQLQKLTNQLLPNMIYPEEVRPLPGRAARRYIFRTSIFWWLLLVPAVWLLPIGWVFIGVPALFTWLGWQRYKDGGIYFTTQHLVLQNRGVNLYCNVIPHSCLQSAAVHQSYFQRRRNLCSISATVLTTSGGRHFQLKDLESRAENNILRWLRSPFHS
ncbi:PH domain-containing protein [Salibacterium aidingense]|uniref:PH domain-containing protein n=1 Tax=Salibacterium aidingense TaxID=384933 RepID=UPI003BE4B4BF